jgi:hypothetical protein
MDSYKFWTISSGILYRSSWRTSLSCFIDFGGGNLFLTLVSKTDQSGSMMFKSDDCAGQGRCWSSPSCSSNHDWKVPGEWMGALSSWRITTLFRKTPGSWDAPAYPTCNSAMQGNNGTNRIPWYCCPNHHRTSPMFHCWNQASLGVLQM